MKYIQLSKGYSAMVDDDSYAELNQYKWYYHNGYAVREVDVQKRGIRVRKRYHMHREINKTPKGLFTDHIDHNRLNNQRSNLRTVTTSQNEMNKTKNRGISKYKGVYRCNRSNKWRAGIVVLKKTIYLGRYDNEIDAAKAYDKAAIEYFGEFKCLNFSDPLHKKGSPNT